MHVSLKSFLSAVVLFVGVGCGAAQTPLPNRAAVLQELNEQIRDYHPEKEKFIEIPSDPVDQCGIAPYWFFAPDDSIFTAACAYHDRAYVANETLPQGDEVRRAVDYQFLYLMLEAVEVLPDPTEKWLATNQAYLMFLIVRELGWMWW